MSYLGVCPTATTEFPTYDNIDRSARQQRYEYLRCIANFCHTPDNDNKVELQMAHHALMCALYEPGSVEAERLARKVRSLLERMTRY